MSSDGRSNELVRDLVRSVVAAMAPEELPLVDGLRHFDDATVVRRLSGRGRRREPLGFGIGEVAMLVTPVVWLVLDGVAQRMAAAAVDRTAQGATAALRRIFRRPAAPVEVPSLTREQLVEVRALVIVSAEQRGLSRGRAEEIADALVAQLALSDRLGSPDNPAIPDPSIGRD
ncbi:hypothetical protein OG871_37915 [Kitasatospora sp. NBC_00374]|uniref:hypothetical protein n=1 Tax=Kitasatospora sp. NBC_00374 TaxID=2975964 RepID=UPI0030E13C2E